MYKYIGTEQQLLDLGFVKKGLYEYVLDDKPFDTKINIWYKDKEVSIDKYSLIGTVSNRILKLFAKMVECGLIIWED